MFVMKTSTLSDLETHHLNVVQIVQESRDVQNFLIIICGKFLHHFHIEMSFPFQVIYPTYITQRACVQNFNSL